MKKLSIATIAALLASCAPVTHQQTATQVTTTASYNTGTMKAGDDNPVLAAIVGIAPTTPTGKGRQPWRAEEIERNSLVLRSNASTTNVGNFGNFVATLPQEMSWNVISSGGVTTVTAVYSSAYAATADYIFAKLNERFSRVK